MTENETLYFIVAFFLLNAMVCFVLAIYCYVYYKMYKYLSQFAKLVDDMKHRTTKELGGGLDKVNQDVEEEDAQLRSSMLSY